ncbi:MAG: phospho-sugar mutase [Bacteroidales bacterium]|jgi:phosphoglucomutase|nr:phospho-sugar mutase [Bacteroidales bacterium]
MDNIINERVNVWLNGNYDQNTIEEVLKLMKTNERETIDAFYKDLEFGTGGLRGIMGVGTNRMNKYTVGFATQGFANYLKQQFPGKPLKVAIAFDSRNNSKFFAEITADVFSANNIYCYLFEELRPTPELSFAVRELQCDAGVMITASHNPKEYNGYKAYWNDGAQLVPPHDINVIDAVTQISSVDEVKWDRNLNLVQIIGEEIDILYLKRVHSLSFANKNIENAAKKIKIVYTPLHGTGITMVPKAFKMWGFENFHLVEEQSMPNGDFPTVASPNPEEKTALEFAIRKAKEIDADLILATDPDADRIAAAVKNFEGDYLLLNGNQTLILLTYYLLYQRKANKKITNTDFVIKTIVSTELIHKMAKEYGVQCFDVLTGFKYIAEVIREYEGKLNYIGGGEESFGYLAGDFVRDKDAISACCLFAEMAADAVANGSNLFIELLKIYQQYGYYKEDLLSITKKGKEGLEEIKQMMVNYRNNPPKEINEKKVVCIKDYLLKVTKDCVTGKTDSIDLPNSDVLQFFTEDGSKISVRPSGTEPKIKYYFAVCSELKNIQEVKNIELELTERIEKIKRYFLK